MAGQSQGALSTLYTMDAADSTFNEPMEFIRENLTATYEIIDTGEQAIRGTRDHHIARLAAGRQFIGGSLWLNPSFSELQIWLPRILGTLESTDEFLTAETVLGFDVRIDRVIAVHEYVDCKVDKAIFRGTKGRPIELELQIKGVSEDPDGSSSISGSLDTDFISVFNQGVLLMDDAVVGSPTARNFDRFVLVIDNHLEVEHNNSRTATDIVARDRHVHLSVSTPYTSTEEELYRDFADGGIAGTVGVSNAAATLKLTNGGKSTTFSFGTLVATAAQSPVVAGKHQIRLPLHYQSFRDASRAYDINVTHDNSG